jgi:tripartite-type tricarboxylate transporter receptor subunit TctC
VKEVFFNQDLVTVTSTPQEFRAFIKSEVDKWASVFKKIGLQPN